MDQDILVLMNCLDRVKLADRISATCSLARLRDKLEEVEMEDAELRAHCTELADEVDYAKACCTDLADEVDYAKAVCTELADEVEDLESENRGLVGMVKEAEHAAARAEGTLNAVAMCLGYVPR